MSKVDRDNQGDPMTSEQSCIDQEDENYWYNGFARLEMYCEYEHHTNEVEEMEKSKKS